jgi:hypothetical protein
MYKFKLVLIETVISINTDRSSCESSEDANEACAKNESQSAKVTRVFGGERYTQISEFRLRINSLEL